MTLDAARRQGHAETTRALYARGLKREAGEAAAAWVRAFPADGEALVAAAEIAAELGSPDAGGHYRRALEAGVADPTFALRALWWFANDHRDSAGMDIAVDAVDAPGRPCPPQLRFLASLGALRAGRPDRAAVLAEPDPGLAPHVRLMRWVGGAAAEIPARLPAGTDLVVFAVMWGERHARDFRALALPSLAAPGNLPALVAGRNAALLVVCDAAARAVLAGEPRLADALFAEIDADAIAGNPAMNVFGPAMHVGLAAARARAADALFLHSDSVYADGSLAHLAARAAAGIDAYCAAGPSAETDAMRAALAAHARPDGTLPVTPRRLVALAFAHLHARSRAMLVAAGDAARAANPPTLLLFKDRDRVRMRGFQPGPSFVSRRLWRPALRFNFDTSDAGLLNRLEAAKGAPLAVDWGADGDRYFQVDLADAGHALPDTAPHAAGADIAETVVDDARRTGMLDRLRLSAFRHDSVLVAEGGMPWPPAPDCTELLEAIEAKAAAWLDAAGR